MCGITAYKGQKNGNEIVISGLKNLEYRGYDSYGLSWINGSVVSTFKEKGKIGDMKEFSHGSANVSMGHTRWATSSPVTKENAHPYLSKNNKISLVHNGIVENYHELKDFLIKKGFKLRTETDTEVIPYLIEYFMKEGEDFIRATRSALLKVEGSFAIVALHEAFDGMICARRDSPLVIGVGDGEFFAASDVPAFLEYCKQVMYLDDDEYAVIGDDVVVKDIVSDDVVRKVVEEITWDFEQAKKGEYDHFMLKEMSEQEFTIKTAIEQDSELLKEITSMINDGFGVFFVGCGTSYHACVSASYVFSHVAKKHINVVLASEFRNYEHFLTDKTLVIGVSQSGETADLLDAMKVAKKHKCKTASIVNVMGSSLTRLCDINVMMNAGPEICVLSTKSYTSQVAILILLAYSCAGKLEEGKKMIDDAAAHVPELISSNLNSLKPLAEKLKSNSDLFLIGRDLAYPSALEGALKVKEVSYIHAEGFAGAELKHGTIALIDKGVPCIALVTDATRQLILSNAMEIKARGGFIIGIDNKNHDVYDEFIEVPAAKDADPILMIIPIQILAYYLALAKGLDPDKPRNLAKSVTVK